MLLKKFKGTYTYTHYGVPANILLLILLIIYYCTILLLFYVIIMFTYYILLFTNISHGKNEF